jgi:hypothetical protein
MGGQKSVRRRGTTWERFCAAALTLPGVAEGTSYRTPALRVREKLLVRLKEDGETIALRVGLSERDVLLQLDPRAFSVTDHYRAFPFMLVRLAEAQPRLLWALLEDAWRAQAGKALVAKRAPGASQLPTPGSAASRPRRAGSRGSEGRRTTG